jgi:O-methyltransferase involved in polyketide biosynthesis
VDLPEVIELRRKLLPDGQRCKTIAQSMLEVAWLEEVERKHIPVIFLAEDVFPYFSSSEIRPLLMSIKLRFPHSE